jgi:phosphoribosylformylglycinamidine synthase
VGAIDPVPTVSVLGQIRQGKHLTRRWAHTAGEKLVFLGATPAELGGSQYLGVIHQLNAGDAPQCDFVAAQKLDQALLALITAGQVHGAHAVAEGGLLCCVAEMLFAPGQLFGAILDLAPLQGSRLDALLFGESQNRAVIIVATERLGSVLADAHLRGVSAAVIGEITANPVLTVRGATDEAVSWPVAELRRGWETSLESRIKLPGPIA